MKKSEAMQFAKELGWTAADAKRALTQLTFDDTTEQLDVLICLGQFAGAELKKRQGLQAAQKGLVTKKVKYIKEAEIKHAKKIRKFEEDLQQERDFWLSILSMVYSFAQRFGYRNESIELALSQGVLDHGDRDDVA